MKKLQKQVNEMECKVHLALSYFTAVLLGRPEEYKTQYGGANLYPSDVLYDWGFRHIDKDGAIIENPKETPLSVAGITCGGSVKMNDIPQVITIWFKDLN